MLKLKDPMFIEAISGCAHFAAARRSSSLIPRPPPVVMLTMASQPCLMSRKELPEHDGALRRPAGSRVASVQMKDRGTGFGCIDGAAGDLLRSHRQVWRHAGRMNRSGDRAADDDFSDRLIETSRA